MGIQIDGTKFVNKNSNAKLVVGSAENKKRTENTPENQSAAKNKMDLKKSATLDISKSGYASLAYDNRPGVVSGKTTEEVYEKLGIISDDDAWRIKDPNSYEKFQKILQEAFEYKKSDNEEMFVKTFKAAGSYATNWFVEQILTQKYDFRAVAYNGIKGLKNRYGDDTEVNVSSLNENDARGDIWRFKGQYNILLTPGQMQSWINDDPEEENLKALLKSLDESMKELREEREKQEDDIEGLMLGLSINDDSSPLFHATFKGNTAGDFTATTAQELFQKLALQK